MFSGRVRNWIVGAVIGLSGSVLGCGSSDTNAIQQQSLTAASTVSVTGRPAPTSSPTPGGPTTPSVRPTQNGIVLVNVDERLIALGRTERLYPARSFLSGDGKSLFLVINEMSAIAQVLPDPVFPSPPEGYLVKIDLETGAREAFALTDRSHVREGAFLPYSWDQIDVTYDGRYVLLNIVDEKVRLEDDTLNSDDRFQLPVYVLDTETKEVTPVNYLPDGTAFDRTQDAFFLGGKDRIVFLTYTEILIRDYTTNSVTRLPWKPTSEVGGQRNGAARDGNSFVFATSSNPTNAIPRSVIQDFEFYAPHHYNLATQQVKLLGHFPDGSLDSGLFEDSVKLASQGRHALFSSWSNDLDPNKTSIDGTALYLYDLDANQIRLIAGDVEGDHPDYRESSISPNGSHCAYVRETNINNQTRTKLVLHEVATEREIILSDLVPNPQMKESEYYENQPDFNFSDDGKLLSFIWRGANNKAYGGVYVYNLDTGQLRDIVAELDLFASSQIRNFASSADGSKVVFNSDEILIEADRISSQLVDTVFGTVQFYLTNLVDDSNQEISVKVDGTRYSRTRGDHVVDFTGVDMSDDGTVAVFATQYALDPSEYETPNWYNNSERVDVFMHRAGTVGTTLVSTGLSWTEDVIGMSLSGDGNTVAVATYGRLLSYNIATGARTQLDTPITGIQVDRKSLSLNQDGSQLTFIQWTYQENQGVPDTLLRTELVTCDLTTNQFQTILTANTSTDFDGGDPVISADGNLVVFATKASLSPADTNQVSDIYRYDRGNGTFELVSLLPTGGTSSQGAIYPSMSGDGRFVTFSSKDSAFATGGPLNTRNVFVRDMTVGTNAVLSRGSQTGTRSASNDLSYVSTDGSQILFRSFGQGIVEGANPYSANLFRATNPFLQP